MLLRELTAENPPAQLHLRLRHAWKLGNPAMPAHFFGLDTIWTDAEADRYSCTATITAISRNQHWSYRACPVCSRTLAPLDNDFWCSAHDTVLAAAVVHTDMAVAYPDNYGELPPPLQAIVGQNVTFKVQLPRTGLGSTYNDFPISKIWGLLVPRAHLSTRLASVSDTTSLRYTNRRFPSFHTFPDTGFYTCSTPLTFACAQAACITRDSFATGRHC
ncbi:hypothetical protein LINGRAPRIM_LOCUS610 [Linum grandiflorum]